MIRTTTVTRYTLPTINAAMLMLPVASASIVMNAKEKIAITRRTIRVIIIIESNRLKPMDILTITFFLMLSVLMPRYSPTAEDRIPSMVLFSPITLPP